MFEDLKKNIKTYNNIDYTELILFFLGFICILYATYMAITYSGQALCDRHSFRQTQTALTAYWLAKNGFSFAYETPVGGFPWSIPFEFPIYQYLVSLVWKITGGSLDIVGRLVSFFFLLICPLPVYYIFKNLDINKKSLYIFCAILFSSPLYIYWGRTFMIETTAIFFSLVMIKFFIDAFFKNKGYFLFSLFASLALLQKITTALPVMVILGLIYGVSIIREIYKSGLMNYMSDRIVQKRFIKFSFSFLIPLILAIAWTEYTDKIKLLSDFGAQLTSSSLSSWNWGTFHQRISAPLYTNVIWKRMFFGNLGTFGCGVAIAYLFLQQKIKVKTAVAGSLLMGLLPLFLFSNLHIVHDYYQSSCLIFLIAAVAISLSEGFKKTKKLHYISLLLTLFIVVSNFSIYTSNYYALVTHKFTVENTSILEVAETLKNEVPQDKYLVVFGNDWSSSIAYFSERKTFTVPKWYAAYDKISSSPESAFGEGQLGGVVLHTKVDSPTRNQLKQWAFKKNWEIINVADWDIALPKVIPSRPRWGYSHIESKTPSTDIVHSGGEGHIDTINAARPNQNTITVHNLLSVQGWLADSIANGTIPDQTFITLQNNAGNIFYAKTKKHPRPDVAKYFKKSSLADTGFTIKLALPKTMTGQYRLGLAYVRKGKLHICSQFNLPITIVSERIHDKK